MLLYWRRVRLFQRRQVPQASFSKHPPPHPPWFAAPGLLEELATLPPRDSLPGMIGRAVSEVPGTPSARVAEEAVVVTPARLDEEAFLAALRRDACGTDVLRSSIAGFTRDTLALEDAIAKAKQQ